MSFFFCFRLLHFIIRKVTFSSNPNIIVQEDFFIFLHEMLQNRPEVSEIYCVKNAKVPLMRFKFSGISVDFPYAQLYAVSVSEVRINM